METLRIVAGSGTTIRPSEIPKHCKDNLARATLHAVERFFETPGVKEDYEKWLIEYRQRGRKRAEYEPA